MKVSFKNLVFSGFVSGLLLANFACANKVQNRANETVTLTQANNDSTHSGGSSGGGGISTSGGGSGSGSTDANGGGGSLPSSCSFVQACEAGTHADYQLCTCVKDNNTCPAVSCAAPPAGCNWVMTVEKGCITSCGKLSCKGDGTQGKGDESNEAE